MVLGGLLHRNKQVASPEEKQMVTSLANTQILTRGQSAAQEAEDRQNKGIDIDMIDPQEIITQIKGLTHYTEWALEERVAEDKDGNTVYEQIPLRHPNGSIVYQDNPLNANGAILIMKQVVYTRQPQIVKQMISTDHVRAWAIATLGYLDKVWPTIWMSPDEADTTWLAIRVAFHDIRKSMTYEEKKKYGIILRMARDLCLARVEDMKEGHKALLLKVRREDLGIHMSHGEGKIK